MKNIFLLLLIAVMLSACNAPKKDKAETTPTPAEPPPVTFADNKYYDLAQQSLQSIAKGDMNAFQNGIADDIVFQWNNGDSLVSKKSVMDYWNDRRTKVIDTITYTKEAWLAIDANKPPSHLKAGNWVFGWALMDITYANKASVKMWIHHVYHFNDQDKIDCVIQFLDRVPIAAALAKK